MPSGKQLPAIASPTPVAIGARRGRSTRPVYTHIEGRFMARWKDNANMAHLNVLLISTYELGRQPFGLASPAAWLRKSGACVTCLDLSVQPFQTQLIEEADLIAFYLPMHTATRMALRILGRVKALNPDAHLCFYGLYAPMNAAYLRKLGAHTILGGEFEKGLVQLVERLADTQKGSWRNPQPTAPISLGKQQFLVPERFGLPPLVHYAHLELGDG